jgi:hypothetical protein
MDQSKNMLFDKNINNILKEMSTSSQGNQTADSLIKQANVLRSEADSLMKQAAVYRAQAKTLNYGSSMNDERVALSQSNALKNAINQKIKQAEQLEAKAKTINPNIKQTYSINMPSKTPKTPNLKSNF